MHRLAFFGTFAILTSGFPPLAADEAWLGFRGPGARGVSSDERLPISWSSDVEAGVKNIAWSVDIPGRSWSSPVIAGDRVFVTSAISAGANHEPKKGLYFGGNRPQPLPRTSTRGRSCCRSTSPTAARSPVVSVECHTAPSAGRPRIHIKNTYASETPVHRRPSDVYAYFGNRWPLRLRPRRQADLEEESYAVRSSTRYDWGTAASPDRTATDRLYILNDNEESSVPTLEALDSQRRERSIWHRLTATRRATGRRRISGRPDAARSEIVTTGTRARCARTDSTATSSGSSAACRASRSARRTPRTTSST